MTELVEYVEKKHGKVSVIGRQIGYNQDDKTWSAYPDYYINFPVMYRKSLWDEIGMTPDTWDNVRIGGAKLKAKGNPVGISLGHSNDPNTTWRGLMWSYGGTVQDETGKHVVLDSKETVEAVKFVAALYKEAMAPDVLSWNDASNNQYINSGVGSLIINPISAYRTAQQLNKKVADDIFVMKPPKGPVRLLVGARAEFLRNLEVRQEQGGGDRVPQVLRRQLGRGLQGKHRIQHADLCQHRAQADADPVRRSDLELRTTSWRSCRPPTSGRAVTGYPGPAWAATDEIYNDFIICDMMAKTATGAMTAEDAVKWATQQCQAIFDKWLHKA